MVAAYLRGVLKPAHRHGLRSALADSLILEAVAAEIDAGELELGALVDATITTALKHNARQDHLRSVFARAGRASELRLFDVHRLGAASQFTKDRDGEISLYQLYQLMQKKGILAAMKQHCDRLSTPDPER